MSHAEIVKAVDEQTKKRLQELDGTIEHLQKSGEALQNFIEKAKTTGQLMCAKLTREKLRSLSAVAQCQAIMVDMQMLITKNELKIKLNQMRAAQAGKDLGPAPSTDTEWSAPTFAKEMAEDNNWLSERLRQVAEEEQQVKAMLEDQSTEGAAPVDVSGLSQENQMVFNELYQELMSLTTVKPEAKVSADVGENSNSSVDTLILCPACSANGNKNSCPSCS